MANEITVNASIVGSKNSVTLSTSCNKTLDMAGDQMISAVQIIGTTAEVLSFVDVTTIGYTVVKNMDATNYIEVDAVSAMTSFPQKLMPGEFVLLKPQTATIYAKANTAACNVQVTAFEL